MSATDRIHTLGPSIYLAPTNTAPLSSTPSRIATGLLLPVSLLVSAALVYAFGAQTWHTVAFIVLTVALSAVLWIGLSETAIELVQLCQLKHAGHWRRIDASALPAGSDHRSTWRSTFATMRSLDDDAGLTRIYEAAGSSPQALDDALSYVRSRHQKDTTEEHHHESPESEQPGRGL